MATQEELREEFRKAAQHYHDQDARNWVARDTTRSAWIGMLLLVIGFAAVIYCAGMEL